MNDPLQVHRSFYDAIETGDIDLMKALWADSEQVSCIHPGAEPVRGTGAVLRTWSMLMANVGYIQFFLTDVEIVTFPPGADDPHTAVVTCTENILSGEGMASAESFAGGKAIATSILVNDGHSWKFWLRHASPVMEPQRHGGESQ